MSKITKRKTASLIERKPRSVRDSDLSGNMLFSFQYFDSSQKFASSFKDWQSVGLLSKAIETITGYCAKPLLSQVDGDKFAIYGEFPPKERTGFEFPKHVPEDAEWARIHITGTAVLAGHVVGNIFYVVFLDKTHKFWLTKRVTGK